MKVSQARFAIRASENGFGKYKVGAAIFENNRLISVGYNKPKTHPVYGNSYSGKIHAEADALMKAMSKPGIDLSGCHIIVYRNNGNLAKPCECCQVFLASAGITKVYYSDNNGEFKYELL